jgi:hypothetical protein
MRDQQQFRTTRELVKILTAKLKLTKVEKAALLRAVKEQAVVTAKFWDVLGELELKYDIEFETDAREISEIAVSCGSPPSVEDLSTLRLVDVMEVLRFRDVDSPNPKG